MRLRKTPRALERLADEELMRLVADKEPSAFEVFYDRHGAAAYSLAYRIAGDRRRAEDVVQEAFLSIWRSRSGYDAARGSIRAWLLGVVRNRAIDSIRREAVRPATLELDERLLQEELASERTEAEVLRREAAAEVRDVLSRLPDDQLQVIELAYFGGFTQAEIAEMLQMPLGTVKGRMRLGLEKLRSYLAEGLV